MRNGHTRRHVFKAAIGLSGAAVVGSADPKYSVAAQPEGNQPIRYCLNTSTIRGQKLTLSEEVDIAAKAGYDGIEPWMREITAHVDAGGSLSDLKKQIADAGLTVDSAIGFANWIVDDDEKREQGFESMQRDMDMLRQIGGARIAAPPVGATDQTDMNLMKAAHRYRELLRLGESMGVTPQVELWGFSKTLSRLGELMFVAIEAGHKDACVLTDVYHIFKGGSDFAGLRLIEGSRVHVMHMNDYPSSIPRDRIGDADRVYPGDGDAPISRILNDMYDTGFRGTLSLELFNRDYWKQDAQKVANTGLQKMKAAVAAAGLS